MSATTAVLSDEAMRELGFTDKREGFWYWCKRVGSAETLNITINKNTGTWEELVMDEDFGQPAYYGRMKPEFRDATRAAVDKEIEALNLAGINVAVDHREYGCTAWGKWCLECGSAVGHSTVCPKFAIQEPTA